MKSLVWVAVAASVLVMAEGTPLRAAPTCDGAHAKPAAPSKSSKHASPPQAKKPKVYGAPIQPPIVKKRAPRKTKATGVASTSDAAVAKRKAHAEAARKAQADLEWRRAHPASADGPR
jgi:hypothetical protein